MLKYILYSAIFCFSIVQAQENDEGDKNGWVYCAQQEWNKQLKDAKEIAREAGKKILEIRQLGELESKDVLLQNGKKIRQTRADIEASRLIMDGLLKNYPTYGFLSQDQMDQDLDWYTKDLVWIVNPLDGTTGFEEGSDDFHVQIGLLAKDEVVVGVSYYPVTDTYVWAIKGQGAWIEKEGVKQQLIVLPCNEKILLKSSSHKIIGSYFKEWDWESDKIVDTCLSSTSRLLEISQGKASLYISLGASPKGKAKKGGVWNYGANVVIANEAGLVLRALDGSQLNLRQPQALLNKGVLLTSDLVIFEKIIQSDWDLQEE